ncbi:MAG: hypothetical protein HY964_10260 [Ignavibacteriales bacterium]|nr:hypothetical protein [Ignavibacteriales bacterium]
MNQTTLWILAILPSLTYPLICFFYSRILTQRRDEVEGLLAGKSMTKFLDAYGPSLPSMIFRRFHKWEIYALPVVLNMGVVILVSLGAIIVRGNFETESLCWIRLLVPIPGGVLAGFAGAYIWSHYEMLKRFSLVDLTPTSIYYLWLRLLIGGILGYVSMNMFDESYEILVAFGLGAFPIENIRDMLRQTVVKKFEVKDKEKEGEPPTLQKLQGMTTEVIERLEEEGITSVQGLAMANPVKLLLKTNFEWTMILDLMDQALLFNYVGDKYEKLRTLGIRSSIEVAEIQDYLYDEDPKEKMKGEKIIELVAAKLEEDKQGIYKLVDTIAEDPQVLFIWELWEEAFSKVGEDENVEEKNGDE